MNCFKCAKSIQDDALFCAYCGRKLTAPRPRKVRGNGMGTAYKRGKTWTAAATIGWYKEGDKLLRERITKPGFKTKKDALEYIPTLRGQKSEDRLTLEGQYNAWKASLKYTKLSISKQTAYRIAFDRLSTIKHLPIGDIRLEDIQPIIDGITSYYPARDVRQVLSHLFQLAMVDERVKKNYAEYIELPAQTESSKDAFTDSEVTALWEDYKTHAITGYILLMIYTGMRLGELQKVQREKIMFDQHAILEAGIKTKLGKSTPILIADVIQPVLKKLFDLSSTSPKLLNMNEDNFYAGYYAALERAGCRRLTPHCCRHTTATALAKANVPPAVIKAIMRHSNYQTTIGYTHIDTAPMLAALNTILGAKM